MTREEFITAAEIAFEKLMTPTRGLHPTRMEEPMAEGGWSLKELAAHLAHWNTVVVRALEETQAGREFDWGPYRDFAAVNAEAVERLRGATLKRVMNELRVTHSTVVEVVRRLSEERLEGGTVPRWLVETVVEHYEHHTPPVEAWAARVRGEGGESKSES